MISRVLSRVRSLWRGVRRGSALRHDMHAEFQHHIELRADDLVRGGLSREEATRRARLEFGSIEQFADEGRSSRGLSAFDGLNVSWLDFKLGFRMLGKYPGLTIVGGIAIAFAVAVGATAFEFITQYLHPRMGIPDADRFVAVRLWSRTIGTDRHTVHDVVRWRHELETIESLGAVRTIQRNLITASGAVGEPVMGAEISASVLRLAGTSPLRGRLLTENDERADANPVAIISHDLWQARLGRDSRSQSITSSGFRSTWTRSRPTRAQDAARSSISSSDASHQEARCQMRRASSMQSDCAVPSRAKPT